MSPANRPLMTPDPRERTLILAANGSLLELAPRLGGSVVRYVHGGTPVLRSAAWDHPQVPIPFGMAAFPLFPFCGRIAAGRFRFDGDGARTAWALGPDPCGTLRSQPELRCRDCVGNLSVTCADGAGRWCTGWRGSVRCELCDVRALERHESGNVARPPALRNLRGCIIQGCGGSPALHPSSSRGGTDGVIRCKPED